MNKKSFTIINELCDMIVNLSLVYEYLDEVSKKIPEDKVCSDRAKELLHDSIEGAKYIKDTLDRHSG